MSERWQEPAVSGPSECESLKGTIVVAVVLVVMVAVVVGGGIHAERSGFVLNRDLVANLKPSDRELAETAHERIESEQPEIVLRLVGETWQNCARLKAGDMWCWEIGGGK